jgi:hypothetical protein
MISLKFLDFSKFRVNFFIDSGAKIISFYRIIYSKKNRLEKQMNSAK